MKMEIITAIKDGFIDGDFDFVADKGTKTTYTKKLELNPVKPVFEFKGDNLMIVVNNIYFDYNKWSIKEESLVQIMSVARILEENPEMKIEINAHTDNRGNDKYNYNLSGKRAKSTLDQLVDMGISRDRLISHGYGETEPIYDCKTKCTEEQHQENRRVEFVVIRK